MYRATPYRPGRFAGLVAISLAACSSGRTPASSTSLSATYLNMSALMASLGDCGSGLVAPMALARLSSSMPIPSQSTVPGRRYQAMLSTPTTVMLPPRQPKRSTSITSTPARAAASAAPRPPGPLPITSTSVSAITGTSRARSVTVLVIYRSCDRMTRISGAALNQSCNIDQCPAAIDPQISK